MSLRERSDTSPAGRSPTSSRAPRRRQDTDPAPPQMAAQDAEEAALGAALLDEAAAAEVVGALDADDFTDPGRRAAFDAIRAVVDRGDSADPTFVNDELRRSGQLDRYRDLIPHLVGVPSAPSRARAYVGLVRRYAIVRRLVASAHDAAARALEDPDALRDELRELLEELNTTDGADPLEYLDLEAIARDGIPEVPWLVPGWLAVQDVALLAGAGGIGKSTTAAALAHALARGEPWCGHEPVRPARVLIVDEEQDEATAARLHLRLGGPHENLRVAVGQGLRLDDPSSVARLERAIVDHAAEVVVLDSVQQAFGATDENSATENGLIYRELFRLRDRLGVGFLLVHHKRKSQPGARADALELVRGTTAHGTQSSAVWYAYSPAADRLNLVQAKRRGAPRTSLAVVYDEDADGMIRLVGEGAIEDTETAREAAEEWVVAYLAEHGDARRATIFEAAEPEGHTERTVKRALSHLAKVGAVERPSRGVYRLPSTDPDQGPTTDPLWSNGEDGPNRVRGGSEGG